MNIIPDNDFSCFYDESGHFTSENKRHVGMLIAEVLAINDDQQYRIQTIKLVSCFAELLYELVESKKIEKAKSVVSAIVEGFDKIQNEIFEYAVFSKDAGKKYIYDRAKGDWASFLSGIRVNLYKRFKLNRKEIDEKENEIIGNKIDDILYMQSSHEIEDLNHTINSNKLIGIELKNQKLNWTGNKNQLYDTLRQLKAMNLIGNTFDELVDFLHENVVQFENDNKETTRGALKRKQQLPKAKRINLNIDLED